MFGVKKKPLLACEIIHHIPGRARIGCRALKYLDDRQKALIINTKLGGDNDGRGAVLGAIFGAAHGAGKFPTRWLHGLREPLPDLHIA